MKKQIIAPALIAILIALAPALQADNYLIWDPGSSNSAGILCELLEESGYEGVVVADIMPFIDNLDNYKPLFVFESDGMEDDMETIKYDIFDYLENGGSLYWEGINQSYFNDFYRDTILVFDIATCITEYIYEIRGCPEGIFDFCLSTVETLAQGIGLGQGEAFCATDLCPCKAVYRETPFKTIVSSLEICCLTDDGPNTRLEFAQALMAWLTLPADVPENDTSALPLELSILQSYPNPFNINTTITYQLPQSMTVSLVIYNLLGQPVETLFKGRRPAGRHETTWEADSFSSGIYFARLEGHGMSTCSKLVLLK